MNRNSNGHEYVPYKFWVKETTIVNLNWSRLKTEYKKLVLALGLTDQQIIEHLPKITHDTLALDIENDNEKFLEKTIKTKQKIKFIEDEEFDDENYQVHLTQKM